MEFENVVWQRSVREGYVVLLRAEAELLLPTEGERIRDFYEKTASACLSWATDVWGERLRDDFCRLSNRERATFRIQRYRFYMRIPWQEGPYVTILCESRRNTSGGTEDLHRICHTWNTDEQTVLPKKQILRLFSAELAKKELPFAPDGIYKEKEKLVIFKNRGEKNDFLEAKLPIN